MQDTEVCAHELHREGAVSTWMQVWPAEGKQRIKYSVSGTAGVVRASPAHCPHPESHVDPLLTAFTERQRHWNRMPLLTRGSTLWE